MAEENTITTVFRADISQFSASAQKLNQYVRKVNSQFAEATAGMGRWSDTTDGLQAKIKQLNGILDADRKKLEMLTEQYRQMEAEGKGNTAQAENLKIAINRQLAAIKKTEAEIGHYTEALDELQDAGVETKQQLNEVTKKAEEQKKAFEDLKTSASNFAKIGLAAIAGAVVGAVKGLSSLVENTAELRLEQGRVQTAFEQSGFSAEFAMKHMDDFYAVLGDTAKTTETLQQLAMFAKTEQEVADYTNILTGVFAKLGEALPTEGLAEAINHTIQLGEVQGSLADALEWSGVTVDDFNKQLAKCNTEEKRSALINKTLTGLYGDASKQYQETNKDVIAATKAQGEYNNQMADIARKVQPALTSFKLTMAETLGAVLQKLNETDLQGFFDNVANVISKLVTNVLPPLMSALSWILDNVNWLVPVLGTLVGVIGGISAAIKIYNTVVQVAKVVQLAWNTALAANPIGLVITAIGGLVAAFVVLWNKSEKFRNFFVDMWEKIKSAASKAKDFLSKVFSSIAQIMKAPFNAVIGLINGAIGALNKIKITIPDWVPKWGGKSFGINIPKIPQLAQGGIVNKPTIAQIGEAGKEAVVPLERNTQWLDKLASILTGKMGAQNVVNNYNFDYQFAGMETTRYALHQAEQATRRIVREKQWN